MLLLIFYLVGVIAAVLITIYGIIAEHNKFIVSDILFCMLAGAFSWIGVFFVCFCYYGDIVIYKKNKL